MSSVSTTGSSSEPALSIVIVNYNTGGLLRRCLSSVFEFKPPAATEVIVVDNASTDGSADRLRGDFPDVALVPAGRNLGFGRANNLAARQALGEFLLFLNPDTVLNRETLPGLLRYAEANPEAGIVGCRVVTPAGRVQDDTSGHFYTFGRWLALRTKIARVAPNLGLFCAERMTVSGRVDWVSGVCLLIRRATFGALGGFDQQMFAYSEDMDLCRRLRSLGLRTHYVPEVTVCHEKGVSFGSQRGLQLRSAQESEFRYVRKHWLRWQAGVYRTVMLAIQHFKLAAWTVRGRTDRGEECRELIAVLRADLK